MLCLALGKRQKIDHELHFSCIYSVRCDFRSADAGVVSCSVTYSVAWRRQGRPIRRRVERLLDFSSDDPGEEWKSKCQLPLPAN